MNKLNTFLSFVLLSFCLFINVSYAFEFVQNSTMSVSSISFMSQNPTGYLDDDYVIGDYTVSELVSYYIEYITNNISMDSIISSLQSDGYSVVLTNYTNKISGTMYIYETGNLDVGYTSDYSTLAFSRISSDYSGKVYSLYVNELGATESYYSITNDYQLLRFSPGGNPLSNTNIITYSTSSVKYLDCSSNSKYCNWTGEYYFTSTPIPDEPDEPIMPTNSEIASVVQSFYDSDLYKNNTNFKDFMVVYSFVTGYYSIIGTDNHLLQEIYYDGAKPSNDDFTYPETWWRFYNYFGNVQNFFYGWDYWLYSTRKEDDTFLPIKYNGIGKINDLFNLKFTNQSIIVYSSYEYKVYEFYPPTEEGEDNSSTVTTIPGDEYTYDENLNPTDSNYSPIQNYIPVNPSQTILNDVDFDEINKTFEENKDILNIEDASWLFTANNKLVGYFIGFLSLLIVFLIISRILGG